MQMALPANAVGYFAAVSTSNLKNFLGEFLAYPVFIYHK